jgi:hypothetical protein
MFAERYLVVERMSPRLFVSGILTLVAIAAGCIMKRAPATGLSSFPRSELIAEIKDFQKTLGFEEEGNFQKYSEDQRALYRCYYTGKLDLPGSYEQLKLAEGSAAGCALDEEKYDVFFYEMEAAASGNAPVTEALAEAPIERLLVVVPHEDFHNQKETERAAPEIAEAASTLIGFLAASEFAKGKYGAVSEAFARLDREPDLFLEKARIVNAYFEQVSGVYRAFWARQIGRKEALQRKEELFSELERECAAITPDPVSFNPCPGAGNNAGLAFERTYSRYYPMLYELSASHGRDAGKTVAALKRLLNTRPRSEQDLLRELSEQAHLRRAP